MFSEDVVDVAHPEGSSLSDRQALARIESTK
jgi:hypothetical protein